MDSNSTILFIILFVILIGSICLDYFRYRKNTTEKINIQKTISTLGLFTLGFFTIILGKLLNLIIIEYFGSGIIILGGLINTIYMWRDRNKFFGVLILIFLLISQYLLFF